MFLVVAGVIVVAIIALSRPQGDVQKGQTVPPDMQIPATGLDGVQSPATTGGSNTASSSRGKLILGVTSGLPATPPAPPQTFVVPPGPNMKTLTLEKALQTQSGVPTPFSSQLKLGPKL